MFELVVEPEHVVVEQLDDELQSFAEGRVACAVVVRVVARTVVDYAHVGSVCEHCSWVA